jgi:predicted TIM-barrel fold metal-dependent hydrolase
MSNEWAIDADAHVTEPADLWSSRLPRKLRDQGPIMIRDDDGVDWWQLGEDKPFASVGMTATAGWPEPFPSHPKNMDEVPLASWDPHARLAYLDSIGVWSQVLYPNVAGFGSQQFLLLKDPELMLACVMAYNDFLVEWCSADSRRLIPVMATPFWDVEATVGEIKRCAARGHRGVLFTGEPQVFDMPWMGHPHWDPVWAAAQDADLSISFHLGSGDFSKGFAKDRVEAYGICAVRVATTVDLFLGNASQVVDLLCSGVLARFPRLKFVSVESGIGAIPFILEAADYTFEDSHVWRERPYFDMKPSEYFRRQVYATWFFERDTVPHVIEKIGADRILFETDYPHPVCLYGNVREHIDAGLAGQPDYVRRRILWENSAELYRVEQPQGAPALV